MIPFVTVHLSPATYLPRWTWLEKTHQFGMEVGIRRETYAVALGYGSTYVWENVRTPDEALITSSYYHLYNLTLYRNTGNLSPFLSLSLAKPVITGVRDREVEGFNSSLQGVSPGLRAGVSYVWRYRVFSVAPTVGLSYYPALSVYRKVDGVAGLKDKVGILRAVAYVSLSLGK